MKVELIFDSDSLSDGVANILRKCREPKFAAMLQEASTENVDADMLVAVSIVEYVFHALTGGTTLQEGEQ